MGPNLIGQTLGKYGILEEIGWGGMAMVYKAHDTVLGRDVALKVLDSRLGRDGEFIQRFLHEARAAARLEHPNIVIIHDVGQVAGCYFIAMKYVDGRSLAEIIHREGPLPPARVARLVSQVADALDYAHVQGVVHRDVKPGNILVSRQDQIILTDFGLAKALAGSRLTQSGVLMGTPAYMSPEQVTGRPVGPATDVYALGVVAYEMLGGRPPFEGETPHVLHAHAYEPPPPLRQVNPRVPEAVAAAVHKALAKEPKQRYSTAGAFAAALEEAAQSEETEVVQRLPLCKLPSPPAPPADQPVLWTLFAVLGAVLLVAALALTSPRLISKPQVQTTATTQAQTAVAVVQAAATQTVMVATQALATPASTPIVAVRQTPVLTNTPVSSAKPIPTLPFMSTLGPTVWPTAVATLSSSTPTPADTLMSTHGSMSANTATPSSTLIAQVTVDRLNMRAGPGIVYDIVGNLSRGEQVNIDGRTPDSSWLLIKTRGGRIGWVSAAYLSLAMSANSIPVALAIPPTPTAPLSALEPTTRSYYPAPILLYPQDPFGRLPEGRRSPQWFLDGPITFRWQPVGQLQPDEIYDVQIWPDRNGLRFWIGVGRTRQTQLTVQKLPFGTLIYCWRVQIVRARTGDPETTNDYEVVSNTPEKKPWETTSECFHWTLREN